MDFIDITNEASSIIQIQQILRDLELLENEFSSVPLSGVYEDETRESVAEFQGKYGLEVTGIVDLETWTLLHKLHDSTRFERVGVRRVQLFPSGKDVSIYPNQRDDVVYVIQYMLSQISIHHDDFEDIEFTGEFDERTQKIIRIFQRKNLLSESGIIDSPTIEALFEEYEGVIFERG